jgi:hypothetical protein
MPDTIKTETTLIEEDALMAESLRFEGEPRTRFYLAGEIIRELRNASGKQSHYASGGNMAHSDKVIDHYDHPYDVGSLPKGDPGREHRTGRRSSRCDGAPDEDQFRGASHRGRGVQDGRPRPATCRLFPSHRTGQRQDLEEALAIKNTDIVPEFSLPPCTPVRCHKIPQYWGKTALGSLVF